MQAGSARIAVLFYANAAGEVPLPSINANWRIVQAATAGVVQYCVRSQQGVGGVWIISGNAFSPSPSIFPVDSIPRRSSYSFILPKFCRVEQVHPLTAGRLDDMPDHAQTPYLSLYLYGSGSPFEGVMNRYMITGLGVNPFDPRGFGAEGVALNSSGALGVLEEQAVLTGDVAATAGIGAAPRPAASAVAVLQGDLGAQ